MLDRLKQKYFAMPVTVRASFWFFVCAFIQKSIVSITTPIFTRLMSSEEYGIFSVFSSWLSILTTVVSLHLYSGVFTQGLIKFEEKRYEFASAMQGLSLTLAGIWGCIYLVIHRPVNQLLGLSTWQMLAMLVIIWANGAFQFWAVEQRVDVQYRMLLPVTILIAVVRPTLGIMMVIQASDKVTARIFSMAVVDLVIACFLFLAQIKKGKVFLSGKIWTYALKFNIPLVPHYLSMSVLSGSDRIMINAMTGASQAGIYTLAYQISQIMTMFNTALLQTVEPWMFKKIKNKEIPDIAAVAYPLFLLVAALNMILILLAPEIVMIFAPPEYREAIWVIPPVAMSVYFMFLYSFFAVFEFYYEKTSYVMAATTLSAAANILLNYIFIRKCGYLAAGYTTLACYILYAGFHFLFMTRICREQLENIRPYRLSVLCGFSVLFMTVGMAFMWTYRDRRIRYGLLLVLTVLVLFNRRKIVEKMKGILRLKKQGQEKMPD